MELKVLNIQGAETGEVVTLNDEIFAVEVSEHAMYLDVKAILANRRQGTHKAKTRAEVRGGGKKPFRQKGTGNARQGSTRSGLMVGGGAIFGPQPAPTIRRSTARSAARPPFGVERQGRCRSDRRGR